MTLEIVIPCYNESDCIISLYSEVARVLESIDIDWSIIFVNDGSKDDCRFVKHVLHQA